jgi:hypothetical protein
MLKRLYFIVLSIIGISFVYARDPIYTQERLQNGTIVITCPSDDDALILLNDYNYNLPDKFVLAVLMKGIWFEEPEELNKILNMKLYILKGTKMTHAEDYGYKSGLTILNEKYWNLNRNSEYYVFFNVELEPIMANYVANILSVTDKDLNQIIMGRK